MALNQVITVTVLLENWLPLTYSLNELNRGVGLADLYLFVLSLDAIAKLRLVHELMQPG